MGGSSESNVIYPELAVHGLSSAPVPPGAAADWGGKRRAARIVVRAAAQKSGPSGEGPICLGSLVV